MVQDDFDDTDVFEQLDVSIAEMENNTVFSLHNFLLSGSPSKQRFLSTFFFLVLLQNNFPPPLFDFLFSTFIQSDFLASFKHFF